MHKTTLLIALSLIAMVMANPTWSQVALQANWLRHTCGYTDGNSLLGGNVWGEAVCGDAFGNSYNAGSFSGNWFVMDTVIEMNTNRFFINKYNASGQRTWSVGASGTTINSIMTVSRMLCDASGNLYLCGTFAVDDSVYMAPNWYPVGSGYIAKYDSNGNNLWCRFAARTGNTSIHFTDMTLVNDTLYVCGNMGYGNQQFGSVNFSSSYPQNAIIVKLDKQGNTLNTKQLDPNSTNEAYGIAVSGNNNEVFVVGQFLNSGFTVDGLNVPETPDATNSFIVKLGSNLNGIWIKKCNTFLHLNQTVGSSIPCLKHIEVDASDNIYVSANGNGDSTTIGSLKFNHRISPNGSYAQDIYLAKLDANGQELWLRHGGSDEMDMVNDLAIDQWGNCLLSVYSGSQSLSGLIFNNDTVPQWHGALVKYDASGNLLYTRHLQEARSLKSLARVNDSTFFATGTGYNPGLPYLNLSITSCEDTVHGYYNPPYKMVMVKMTDSVGAISTSNTSIQANHSELIVYPNPAEQELFIGFSDRVNPRKVFIYNGLGQLCRSEIPTQSGRISVQNLPPGPYFIVVRQGEKYSKSQIVIAPH